jgi:excisionase family DNA binding protein
MEKSFYSLPEAAGILGISRIAVFKKVRNGKIAAIRIGRNWAIPADALHTSRLPAPAQIPPLAHDEKNPTPVRQSADSEMSDMGWD